MAIVTEQRGDIEALNSKMEKVEEKINNLQKEVTNLINYSHAPKETLPAGINKQESKAQEALAVSPPAVVQGGPSLILHCKHGKIFRVSQYTRKRCLLASRKIRRFYKLMRSRENK